MTLKHFHTHLEALDEIPKQQKIQHQTPQEGNTLSGPN